MSTVPSGPLRVDWGANTTFVLSGVTYKSIANFDANWGYRIHEEVVTGQNDPYLGTGVFHGEIKIEALSSNDNRFEGAVAIVSGIAPSFGMTWSEGDTTGTGASGIRTWTLSGKFTNVKRTSANDKVVMLTLTGILGTAPTVVNS